MRIGRNYPEILRRLRHLVISYQEQERWKEAESIAIEVIWLDKRTDSHFEWLIKDMRRLGSIYRCQRRWEDAEVVVVEKMELRERHYGADHPLTVVSVMDIVQVYGEQKRWGEAESRILPVVAKLKDIKGESHPCTIRAMRYLALIWHARNDQSKALSLMSKTACLSDETLTPSHPSSIACRYTINEWLSEANLPPSTEINNDFHGSSPKFDRAEAFAVEGIIGNSQGLITMAYNAKKKGGSSSVDGLKESLYKGKITRSYVERKISSHKEIIRNHRLPASWIKKSQILLELLTEYALL